MSFLKVDQVVAGYGAHDEILKKVDMVVEPGEIVSILGPNGAGKSTLLKTVAGLVAPRSGTVEFVGADIAGLRPRDVSRRGIVFVPQEHNIFASLSIEENLEIASYLDKAEYRTRLAQVYARMPELADRRRLTAGALSGGQRQSLAMAMALMVGPRLMLLDEPTAGLSPAAAEKLFALVRAIRDDGVTIAMVEQNALRSLMVSDRAYILVDGRNARSGSAQELINDAEIRQIFLGEK
ncbi:ABC transporter ATP-binding protein [Bosea sp. BK604]|uniref:ABC transporter ATP-binding protein n=1 Tax=Bosea sp. BK604 TaxID=2512180 RepID=UPI0010D10D37|nr:ABC transporter ATP-binding protein [Bosea sp. BK604]TCR63984.1 branched-chain amino acid transport system ATP-binding protein/neutral amino acid transport system ATP-binding protein [Bosea sp. BK604]